ncbi:hypothetical protein CN918_29170 [Priestia megaterium]|nr:hypothetical protein CN918_29170 [Priestia megaterium]
MMKLENWCALQLLGKQMSKPIQKGNGTMQKQELAKKFADQVLRYKKQADLESLKGNTSMESYYLGQMQAVYDTARMQFDIWNFDINPHIREYLDCLTK